MNLLPTFFKLIAWIKKWCSLVGTHYYIGQMPAADHASQEHRKRKTSGQVLRYTLPHSSAKHRNSSAVHQSKSLFRNWGPELRNTIFSTISIEKKIHPVVDKVEISVGNLLGRWSEELLPPDQRQTRPAKYLLFFLHWFNHGPVRYSENWNKFTIFVNVNYTILY